MKPELWSVMWNTQPPLPAVVFDDMTKDFYSENRNIKNQKQFDFFSSIDFLEHKSEQTTLLSNHDQF